MKNMFKLVLVAAFSLTSVAAFANMDGEEKPNTNKETTVAAENPAPAPAPSSGGCGCGKPKGK